MNDKGFYLLLYSVALRTFSQFYPSSCYLCLNSRYRQVNQDLPVSEF